MAGDEDIWGVYRLVSAERKILDTGVTEAPWGERPNGYITYDKGGRMMCLVTYEGRIRPEKPEATTQEQRDSLYQTMFAYGGTYSYFGDRIEHHIDVSWNETWTGTTGVRTVTRTGERLSFTAPPFPYPTDGKLSVLTAVWEKLS